MNIFVLIIDDKTYTEYIQHKSNKQKMTINIIFGVAFIEHFAFRK